MAWSPTPGSGAYCATKFGRALGGLLRSAGGNEVKPFGINVLLVEPGAFRTGLAGAATVESAEIADYADTVGATRAMNRSFDGAQPGDPAKAAAAILSALNADNPPLRLALGTDAVDAIGQQLRAMTAELATWADLGRATALD